MGNLRTLFESDYPGKEVLFKELVKPIFAKARDTTLTDEQELSDVDKKQIKSFKIFAQVRGGFPVTFADVELKDSVALKRSRVNIQNCVRKVMANDSNAIIFFHFADSKKEWRVSYVNRADTLKNSTNAKRYTYLCGADHSCRTIAERFETLLGLSVIKDENMLDAFSVEPLSKDFFEKYREHYADLVEYISGKRFVKKGGKFVEEKTKNANGAFKEVFGGDDKAVRDYVKKMMGRLVFLQFLQKKGWLGVEVGQAWGTGDKNFIYNLFQNASEDVKKDFLKQALEPLFFNSLNNDRGDEAIAPKAVCDIYGKKVRIPYLNGGLFEEDELDKKKVKFKKEHFQDLLDFFKQYNFTIDETDPDDMEIGVDPEMLGKIFENLLEDNKDKGAFYTPKEIVQYMCRESLIAYLLTDSKISEEQIRDFVVNHNCSLNDAEKADVLKALLDVKICDPAVGSGAFPMGMLNELLACTLLLTGEGKTRADLKKHIVKNNIYGVDIEKGAVDIARLRFWLAIIVDEENPLPLPNLDYKIMQGNSLLESFENTDLSNLTTKSYSLFDNEDMIAKLVKAINGFYIPKDNVAKSKIRAQICENVLMLLKERQIYPDVLEKLKKIDLHENNQFFLWHTWFNDVFNRPNDCNGFDIVIGNPPYVKEKTNKEAFNGLKGTAYYKGKMDLWFYFACVGLDLAKQGGILSFIAQNQWYTSDGAFIMREKIRNEGKVLKVNDFNTYMVFNEASTQTMIFIIQKDSSQNEYEFSFRKILSETPEKQDMLNCISDALLPSILCQHNIYNRFEMNGMDFIFNNDRDSSIINKVHNKSNFKFTEKEITQGIIGGPDNAFKLTKEEVKQLTKDENENIHKFYTCTEKYVSPETDISIFYSTKENTKSFSKKDYPFLYEKLSAYSEELKSRRETLNGKNKWFHCWWPREESTFSKGAKIIWTSRTSGKCFTYTEADFYGSRNLFFIKTNRINLKYVTAFLNSSLCQFVMEKILKHNGQLLQIDKVQFVKIPLYNPTDAEAKPIISVVDKILAAKRKDPSADTSALEKEIDALVYKLYGLTEEEKAIIENS